MTILCVDGEPGDLRRTISLCRGLPQDLQVLGFAQPGEALSWLEAHTADVALLETELPEMSGIALAERIGERHPDTAVIFLTGSDRYAVDAFALHVSGYLLKPASAERLAAEVSWALADRRRQRAPAHITVQTFGNFELLVDGKPLTFARSKAKELLACLVDRQGRSITRAEAFALLWEDGPYDRPRQKQLDVIIRSLRSTLTESGIGEILEMKRGTLRICPEMLDCDLYHFFDGDIEAVNAYRGEYMSSYSWASLTEAYMDRINKRL